MALPDSDSIATYNGAPNGVLIDYSPVEDPTTDQPAAGAVQQQATTAAASRTATRAYCVFTYASGSSAPVVEHDSNWGNSVSVVPVVTRVSAGLFTVAWPATVTDAIGAIHTLNLRRGWSNIESTGAALQVFVSKLSANSMQLIITNSGIQNDPTGFPVAVYVL